MDGLKTLNRKLKSKLKSKDYDSAVEILKEEILKYYVQKLKQKDCKFKYTDVLSLIKKANALLTTEEQNNLNKYFMVTNDECCVEYELHNLMDIFLELKKGGNSNDF